MRLTMVRSGILTTMATVSATSSDAIIQLVSPRLELSPNSVVEHEGFGEEIQPGLGCVVAGASGEGVFAGQAGDVDDESSARFGEAGERFAGAIEGAVQIEIDIAAPIVEGHVPDSAKDAFAGVVDEDIEAAKGGVGELEEARDVFGLTDVRRVAGDLAELLHGGDRVADSVLGPAADGHGGAFAQEPFGDGTSDAARAARHNRNLAG